MTTRTAKGWRWAGNTMMPFGVFFLFKMFYMVQTGLFKYLVEGLMIVIAGILFAAIAFGLGWLAGLKK